MSFTITVIRNTGRTEFYDAGEWFQHEQVINPSFRIEIESELQPITLYRGDKAYVMNELGNTVGKIEEKEDRQFVVNEGGESMIALTQENREKLIAQNSEKLKGLKDAVKQKAFESVREDLEFEIQSTEIALASLKANVTGHIFKDGTQFYHHPSSTLSMAIAQGDHAIALYAAPPVLEIKLPDDNSCEDGLKKHGLRTKSEGISQLSDGFRCGFAWHENEIKRLNGLGE